MTTNHIDQLTQWWDAAEPGIPGAGDTVIFDERHRSLGFHVTQAMKDHPRGYDNARILSRAPKPKPAWHDAVAVMAALDVNSYDEWSHGDWPERRELWVRDGEAWESVAEGITVPPERLIDPTPLIEAKATDEMVEKGVRSLIEPARALADIPDWRRGQYDEMVERIVTAALGLDPA